MIVDAILFSLSGVFCLIHPVSVCQEWIQSKTEVVLGTLIALSGISSVGFVLNSAIQSPDKFLKSIIIVIILSILIGINTWSHVRLMFPPRKRG